MSLILTQVKELKVDVLLIKTHQVREIIPFLTPNNVNCLAVIHAGIKGDETTIGDEVQIRDNNIVIINPVKIKF